MTPTDSNCCKNNKSKFSKSKLWAFANEIHAHQNLNNCSHITPYLISLLDIAYFTGISPSRICPTDLADLYVWKPPGKLRKAVCGLWHVFALTNIFTDLKQISEGTNGSIPNAISMIYKIAYFLYLFYIASFLALFWTRMESLVDILNETGSVTLNAELDIKEREKANRIVGFISVRTTNLIIKYGTVIFIVTLWGFMNNTTETMKNIWQQIFLEESGIHGLFSQSGRFVIRFLESPLSSETATEFTAHAMSSNFRQKNVTNGHHQNTESYPQWLIESLGAFHFAVDLTNTFCWILADLQITFWSLHFRKLFDMILAQENKMKTRRISMRMLMLFTKASYLIQRFSNTIGYIILTCVMSETLYISTQTSIILTGQTLSLPMLITSIMSFLPFFTVLICSAGVHYRAGEFSYFLKEKFLREGYHYYYNLPNTGGAITTRRINIDTTGGAPEASAKYFFNDNYSLTEEIHRGLMIIFHDLASNVIGVQGYFFTISYAFMGTVLSGIFTYTVVALQLVSSNDGK